MRRIFAGFIVCLCLCLSTVQAQDTFPPTSTPTIAGLDVSAWQRTIDWPAVRAAGYDVAMLRASEGDSFVDPYFERNYQQATTAGVRVGFYHFMTATTVDQAVAQADFFADTIAGKTPDCLLALDYGSGGSLSPDAFTACALAFLDRVQTRTGYGVMLYTDAWAARARYGASVARYPIWVANYGVELPEANGKWDAWVGFQFSDSGVVAGIEGNVDLDAFTAQVFQNAAPTPTPVPTPTPEPTPIPTPTPAAGRELLYYQADTTATLAQVAGTLGVSDAVLDSLNDISGNAVQAGQIVRYPSELASSGEAFSGLHILQRDESLGTLARRYGVTAAALMTLNAFESTRLPAGQIVRLPRAPGRSNVPAPPDWILENAVVAQPGQTLEDIAALFGIPAQNLRTINGLPENAVLRPGEFVYLKPYGNGSLATVRGAYAVRRGDALIRIARHFGTTAQALYAVNNISNLNLIYPGQILWIPD